MIPDWLPQSLWDEFRKHRQKIKAPMTPYAETLILVKLDHWKADGADTIAILNESIENGWRGVFLNGHKGKIKCKTCGSENWISMSGGKCQACRK